MLPRQFIILKDYFFSQGKNLPNEGFYHYFNVVTGIQVCIFAKLTVRKLFCLQTLISIFKKAKLSKKGF